MAEPFSRAISEKRSLQRTRGEFPGAPLCSVWLKRSVGFCEPQASGFKRVIEAAMASAKDFEGLLESTPPVQ